MPDNKKYNPAIHHRHSIRLKGYDYSKPGRYFITICIQNHANLLKDEDGKIYAAGEMVFKWFKELENKFPDIKCDEFICMPNHIHFIIFNVGADLCVGPELNTDLRVGPELNADLRVGPEIGGDLLSDEHALGEHIGSPLRKIIQWYKTMTTNEYIRGVKNLGWEPFDGKLWQRNYYEHIIRDEKDLKRIRLYIQNNPYKY